MTTELIFATDIGGRWPVSEQIVTGDRFSGV